MISVTNCWSLHACRCLALGAKLPLAIVEPFVSFNVVKSDSLSQLLDLLASHLLILLERLVQCMLLLFAQSILMFTWSFRLGELYCDLVLRPIISELLISLRSGRGDDRCRTPSCAAKGNFLLLRLDISYSVTDVSREHLGHQQIDPLHEAFTRVIHSHFKSIFNRIRWL